MPVHDTCHAACEYLCLAIFMPLHDACFFQGVSGYCALPYIMPTHDASCLFRVWVASVPCNILCLFIIPLGFPGCEWLLCLAIFMLEHNAYSWLFRLWVATVHILAHGTYSWLSSLWVATMPFHISCLITIPVLDSPESEWLLCLTIFHASSWCIFFKTL